MQQIPATHVLCISTLREHNKEQWLEIHSLIIIEQCGSHDCLQNNKSGYQDDYKFAKIVCEILYRKRTDWSQPSIWNHLLSSWYSWISRFYSITHYAHPISNTAWIPCNLINRKGFYSLNSNLFMIRSRKRFRGLLTWSSDKSLYLLISSIRWKSLVTMWIM